MDQLKYLVSKIFMKCPMIKIRNNVNMQQLNMKQNQFKE